MRWFLSPLLALAFATCGGNGLTFHNVPDTRPVNVVLYTDAVSKAVFPLLDSLRTEPGVEHGACLYGTVKHRDPAVIIETEQLDVAAPIDTATAMSITFDCPPQSQGLPLIGDLHTHPAVRLRGALCFPSDEDFDSFVHDDRLLFFDIYCQNGLAYRELKDGRWRIFQWYNPANFPSPDSA